MRERLTILVIAVIPHDSPQDHGNNPEHGHVGPGGDVARGTDSPSPEEPHRTTVPFVRDLRDTLRDAHQRVRDATRSSTRTQKIYYDERSKQATFTESQLVWLFWPRRPVRQKFRKLQWLWTGLRRIELFKSPLVMVLKHTVKRTR